MNSLQLQQRKKQFEHSFGKQSSSNKEQFVSSGRIQSNQTFSNRNELTFNNDMVNIEKIGWKQQTQNLDNIAKLNLSSQNHDLNHSGPINLATNYPTNDEIQVTLMTNSISPRKGENGERGGDREYLLKQNALFTNRSNNQVVYDEIKDDNSSVKLSDLNMIKQKSKKPQ